MEKPSADANYRYENHPSLSDLLPTYRLSDHQTDTGRSIELLEKFAISENREDALKELIPGTREYYYHALHAQNQGDTQELKRIIGLWIKRYGNSSQVKEIQNRQALLDFEKDPEKTYSHLKNELRPNFNHSRLIEGRKPTHPTKLDPDAIGYDNFLNQAFRQYKNIQGVSDRGLETLDHDDLNSDRLRHFLSRLQRPDVPNLPAFVAKDLKAKLSRGFGSHGIHRNMTKAQLDELLQLEPKLIDNSNFINAYLTKLAPSDDVDAAYDLRKRKSTSTASTSFPNGSLPPTTHSRRTQSITCSGYSAPGANGLP